VSLARVNGDTLIPASRGVFTGKPLTTGATAAPVVTEISGALNTLVDNGALTTTGTAFATSAAVNNTTPTGGFTTDCATVGATDGATVGATVGTTVGTTEAVGVAVGVGVGVGTTTGATTGATTGTTSTGAAGLTDDDALEATFVPTLLVAFTVNV